MRVLLLVNNKKDNEYKISYDIICFLQQKNVSVYSEDVELVNKYNVNVLDEEILRGGIDFAIVLGGDGTILKYACKYAKYGFPYVGINLGRVGALAILELENYKPYIERIINGDYIITHQLGLDGVIKFKNGEDDVRFTSYNDIVLHRGLSLKLLPLLISVNESNKDVFYADGVIIATPIGSSAYNVSAGGPLLSYGSKSYVITPMCPQSKSFVPLVVSDDDKLCLSMKNKANVLNKEVIVSVDGYFKYFISPFDEIYIEKSQSSLKMIKFDESDSLYNSVYKAVSSIAKGEEK